MQSIPRIAFGSRIEAMPCVSPEDTSPRAELHPAAARVLRTLQKPALCVGGLHLKTAAKNRLCLHPPGAGLLHVLSSSLRFPRPCGALSVDIGCFRCRLKHIRRTREHSGSVGGVWRARCSAANELPAFRITDRVGTILCR